MKRNKLTKISFSKLSFIFSISTLIFFLGLFCDFFSNKSGRIYAFLKIIGSTITNTHSIVWFSLMYILPIVTIFFGILGIRRKENKKIFSYIGIGLGIMLLLISLSYLFGLFSLSSS